MFTARSPTRSRSRVDLDRRDDRAQVGGHRLVQGQQLEAPVVDLDVQLVDRLVAARAPSSTSSSVAADSSAACRRARVPRPGRPFRAAGSAAPRVLPGSADDAVRCHPSRISRSRSLRSACSAGAVKMPLGAVELDQASQPEERRVVGHAGRLLHVVRDDDDGVVCASGRRPAPRCAAWRSGRAPTPVRPSAGSPAGSASARAMHSRCCWPPESASADSCRRSLTSSHKRRLLQALFDPLGQLGRCSDIPLMPQAVGDVLEDGLRKRVGLLEHHADLAPQRHRRPRPGP